MSDINIFSGEKIVGIFLQKNRFRTAYRRGRRRFDFMEGRNFISPAGCNQEELFIGGIIKRIRFNKSKGDYYE